MGVPQVYTAQEVMPELNDAVKILTAKFSYDSAKATKGAADFETWINDKQNYFKCAPRGIAYSVSKKSHENYVKTCQKNGWTEPKSPETTALRYLILAIAIGWDELIQELRTTLRYWGYHSDDIKIYAEQVWQIPSNSAAIGQVLEQAQQSNKIKLIEAVEKHNKLNPKLFTKEELLKEKVRAKMLEIVDEFKSNLAEQNIEIKIKDILFVGSNANYNYTKDSDIDLHIVTTTKNIKYSTEIADSLYSAYRSLFNKNLDISIYDIPLELYVETEITPRNSNGIYSVKKDKWVKKPVHEEIPEYDKKALEKLVTTWEAKCDKIFDKIKAGKLDDEKQVVKLIKDIYDKLRKTGIAKSEYATENLAFKELRNKGYLDKLKASKHELISKRLSLEERLDRHTRATTYNQIASAAKGHQPIIQDNGVFYIYNLKEAEVAQVVQALRKLPQVVEVYSQDSGKYDFSNTLELAMNRIPKKYYNIRGRLDDNLL